MKKNVLKIFAVSCAAVMMLPMTLLAADVVEESETNTATPVVRAEQISSTYTRYSVQTSSSVGGEVETSSKRIAVGETVKLKVLPDYGYTLESLTVKDTNNSTIEVTRREDGRYTFIMPSTDVTVVATFNK